MRDDGYRYWTHSQDFVDDEPAPDAPTIPPVGSALCPVPDRGAPCTYPDGNPRKVADGLLVCGKDAYVTDKRLAELPDLWGILGDPTRTQPRSLGSAKRTDAPAPASDNLRERAAITTLLVGLERSIHALTKTPVISEEAVRAQTRELAVDASRERDAALLDLASMRAGDKRADGVRTRAAELRQQWEMLDWQARSGLDVVEARAARIRRYMDHLLASEAHAVATVTGVRGVHFEASKVAYPLPAGIRVECPTCRTRVRLRYGEEVWCPGEVETPDGPQPCPEHGEAEWWAQQLGVELRMTLTDDEAVAWLRDNHRLNVAASTVRSWAARGKVTGFTELRDGVRTTVYGAVELLNAATTERTRTGAQA